MRYTLVVGAAPLPEETAFYERLLLDADRVVAADAAGEWCADLGRIPDIVLGDFDSALPGAAERLAAAGAEVSAYPRDKDETDLEIAVAIALERYGAPIVLTAAFSGLLDHTLASLGTLLRSGPGAQVREPGWIAHVATADRPFRARVRPGAVFSVVAVGPAAGVDVSGGHWPLVGASLDPLSGLGVSNVTSGEELAVSVREGSLIVLIRTASG